MFILAGMDILNEGYINSLTKGGFQTPEHLLKYWPRVRIKMIQLSLSGLHHKTL